MIDKHAPASTPETYFQLEKIGAYDCGTMRDIKLAELRDCRNISSATPCRPVSDAKWRQMLMEKAGQTGEE